MNVILTIGRQQFLLPSSTGVENMMRVMARAVAVYDRTWDDDPRIEVELDVVKVEMKFVPPGTRFVRQKDGSTVEVWTDAPGVKRKALPGQKLLKP